MKKLDHKTCTMCGCLSPQGENDDFIGTCPHYELEDRPGLYIKIPREQVRELAADCSFFAAGVEGVSYGEFLRWRTSVASLGGQQKIELYLRILALIGAGAALVQVAQGLWR